MDEALSGGAPADFEEYRYFSNGQEWMCAWYPGAEEPPEGKRHGSAAVCVTEAGKVVLVSEDGLGWGLPGGRPEGDEDWRATLEREVWEEACASVREATLLGFGRGECLQGPEKGLVLVRSLWVATVTLNAWAPRFETTQRLLTDPGDALERLFACDPNLAYRRLFREAGPFLEAPG